jgi:hypothetical protein
MRENRGNGKEMAEKRE